MLFKYNRSCLCNVKASSSVHELYSYVPRWSKSFPVILDDVNLTYPIIPERTRGCISVLGSSLALGGFQIKVMVDVGDIKPCLQRYSSS